MHAFGPKKIFEESDRPVADFFQAVKRALGGLVMHLLKSSMNHAPQTNSSPYQNDVPSILRGWNQL